MCPGPVVVSYDHPGVVGGVVTGEGLACLAVVVVLLSEHVTHDVGRVAAAWDNVVQTVRGLGEGPSHSPLSLNGHYAPSL